MHKLSHALEPRAADFNRYLRCKSCTYVKSLQGGGLQPMLYRFAFVFVVPDWEFFRCIGVDEFGFEFGLERSLVLCCSQVQSLGVLKKNWNHDTIAFVQISASCFERRKSHIVVTMKLSLRWQLDLKVDECQANLKRFLLPPPPSLSRYQIVFIHYLMYLSLLTLNAIYW